MPGGKCKAYVSFKESKITAVGAGKSAYFWCDSSQLVRWIYDEIDDDKDAQISRAELRTSPFDATLRANWDLIDTSGDHFATWEEWSTYFNGLKTTIGDKWRAYILRTGCKGAGGESSCVPPMQAQPSPTYGACTACSNAVTDDGRQCKELPAMHCSSLANGTVACTVEHGVATDTTYLAAFGSAFEDPDCAWGGSTAWIGQAEMSGQLCSFAKAPAEAVKDSRYPMSPPNPFRSCDSGRLIEENCGLSGLHRACRRPGELGRRRQHREPGAVQFEAGAVGRRRWRHGGGLCRRPDDGADLPAQPERPPKLCGRARQPDCRGGVHLDHVPGLPQGNAMLWVHLPVCPELQPGPEPDKRRFVQRLWGRVVRAAAAGRRRGDLGPLPGPPSPHTQRP